MQRIIVLFYKIFLRVLIYVRLAINRIVTFLSFYCNGVQFSKFLSNGIPYVMVALGGSFNVGTGFKMNNGLLGNPIEQLQKCLIFLDKGAAIIIGENAGVSSTAIVAHKKICIGNNVKIGGGVCIYDTDFHSLNSSRRIHSIDDRKDKICNPVVVNNNAFIGAHSTILKGVIIGENSIVGACSVVTKDIPSNEIWAGNPAKFIRRL